MSPSPFHPARDSIIAASIITLFVILMQNTAVPTVDTMQQPAAAASHRIATSTTMPVQIRTSTTTASTHILRATSTPLLTTTKPLSTDSKAATPTQNTIERIQNPYTAPPFSIETLNAKARAALVNIICEPLGGSIKPISASGVIIDPRGVILTNAHVAQYVLLAESPSVDLSCIIRSGSPASGALTARVIFIPPVWVNDHVADIRSSHMMGTGEHDYALLRITGSATNTPAPTSFPFLPYDTRAAIGFVDDQVLVAGYPAEFVGASSALYDLYAVSAPTAIQQLLTFKTGTVDALSLGGTITAQSGSSGGVVANLWGYLIGIIATTSEGATTADRTLRAITVNYIDRDLLAQTGQTLASFLAHDLQAIQNEFDMSQREQLTKLYIDQLSR